ncbi:MULTISPECIES: 4-hydroxybenzoate octaprenyltransferase [Candidatus Ichthyocystis]|uniref:4-hydroxybenzoate octaprenyltransferase n=1 Tax=Candidatus Ichthyocystis TaxID=2929841 RepID=UPI000B2DD182|nr:MULTISPECIES: 4-hydroxybenzoate octaprenyltransferase [Ichthyocystis]
MLRQYLINILDLIRFNKPVGTLLLLWPTLTGLWFASNGTPSLRLVLTFVVCTFLSRSAGCCFNDIVDRKIDGHVKRTLARPLVTGRLSVSKAISTGIALLILSFILIIWLPVKVWMLAVVAVILMITYPFTKRLLKIPQAYLGICFGFGIPMTYEAVQNQIPKACILMWIASSLWTLSYDTIYAMVDRDDDIAIGIESSALFWGSLDLLFVNCCGFMSIIVWALAGFYSGARLVFYLGLIMAGAVMMYLFNIITSRSRSHCLYAFTKNHWIGFIIFISTVANFILY